MLKLGKGSSELSIGQVAVAAGVNVETIRYYQRIRLLRVPARTRGEIARYSDDDLRRLQFVKRAQRLGFALEEIRRLLELADGRHCAETKRLAERKLSLVVQKISDLSSMEQTLRQLVAACSRRSNACGCPIIDALLEDERRSCDDGDNASNPRRRRRGHIAS